MKKNKFLKALTVGACSLGAFAMPLFATGCDSSEVNDLNTKIETLTEEKTEQATEIATLKDQKATLQAQLTILRNSNSENLEAIENLEAEIAELEARIAIINAGQDNVSVTIDKLPTLEDKDGFAGEWKATVEDGKVELNSTWGNGTMYNPYKIAEASHFTYLLQNFSKLKETHYYNTEGVEVQENEAKVNDYTKVDVYPTCKTEATYSASKGKWLDAVVVETNTVYVELIKDIDLSELDKTQDYSGDTISINFNGNGHKITGLDGTLFESSENMLFNIVVDSEFTNIELVSTNELTGIAVEARGALLLDTVTTSATDIMEFFDADDEDRNRGPFIKKVKGSLYDGETNIVISNCVNNVDVFSTASYSGVFIGGYVHDAKVTFDSCVNNGNFTSTGTLGLFFGNSATGIITQAEVEAFEFENLVIKNCINNGILKGATGTHILCAEVEGGTKSYLNKLDNGREGVVETVENSIQEYVSEYQVTHSGHDIVIEGAEGSDVTIDTAKYDYELIMWRGVSYRDTRETFRATFTFSVDNNLLEVVEGVEAGRGKLKAEDMFYDVYTLSSLKQNKPGFELPTGLEEIEISGGKDYAKVYKYIAPEGEPLTISHQYRVNNVSTTVTHEYSGLFIIDDTVSEGNLACSARFNPGNLIFNPPEVAMNFRLIITDKETGEIVNIVPKLLFTSDAEPKD